MAEIKEFDLNTGIKKDMKVYLVFPGLEKIVSNTLSEFKVNNENHKPVRQRILTLDINAYHKVNNKQAQYTLDDTLKPVLKSSTDVYDAIIITDDYYVENLLEGLGMDFTVIYPGNEYRKQYLGILDKLGYENETIKAINKGWDGLINAVNTSKSRAEEVFSNYIGSKEVI